MKVSIDKLKPNPFRDFSLYPLDEEQVERLRISIDDIGFFTSVAARPNGTGYELAAGHHRMEAAKRAKLKDVDVNVNDYTDADMVKIMALENLTQRGHNAAATTDSVAAFARIVAKEVLLGEGDAAKILAASSNSGKLAGAQMAIASDGPGKDLLYRAINGFSKAERKANKHTETITETEISQSLATLKDSGHMGKIVADALAEVNAIRAERDAAEAKAAKTKEAQAALAEKQKAAAPKRQKEREAVKAQATAKPIYDARCGPVFRLTSHEAAFREAITSENGRRFFTVKQQLPLAKEIRAGIDAIEQKRRHSLGSVTIKQMVNDRIAQAISTQKAIDKVERQALLEKDAIRRIDEKWTTLTTTVGRAVALLEELVRAESEWAYATPFPFDAVAIERLDRIGKFGITLSKKLGLGHA